jgi:hypothetical protein
MEDGTDCTAHTLHSIFSNAGIGRIAADGNGGNRLSKRKVDANKGEEEPWLEENGIQRYVHIKIGRKAMGKWGSKG